MRVLINHMTPQPNVVTGITIYLWSILDALTKSGRHTYVLATPWSKDALPDRLRHGSVTYVYAPNFRNETLACLRDNVRVGRLAKKNGCDLIMNVHPIGGVFLTHYPTVTVVHDLYRLTQPEIFRWPSKLQWRIFVPAVLRRSKSIVAVSNATAKAIANYYPFAKKKTVVVHEASRIKAYPEGITAANPRTGPYGLMVANITASKNVVTLIDALEIMYAKGVKCPFVIIGRDDAGILERRLRASPQLNIHRIPFASDEEMLSWYINASIYVNTSLAEGFCLPILEAQVLGVPVICSDIPVLREVAGDAALFFGSSNCDGLADAIERLLNSPDERARLAALGLVNVQKFSWEKAAQEMEEVFEKASLHKKRAIAPS